ncbi:MAG: polysaccharide biosynthesis C-terminal domain-containing protein, partial [Lachnospiraceae bacterium]|nr:polysaccharide biosynthesis C-terminal domain-containing protein [Lachnospiraceae bacterium]
YEYSNKIITILVSLIGAVGTVMYPRACAMAAKKDYENQKKFINYSFFLVSMIAVGAMFGLFAVAKDFAVFYYGAHFSACGGIIIAMSPLVFIIGMGDILRTQYMIPNHMDVHFNASILMNAVVNLVLSFLLIPKIGIFGAVAGTASAELFGFIYQFAVCRSFIRPGDIIENSAPFFLMGAVMYAAVRVLKNVLGVGLGSFLIQVAAGVLVYGSLSLVYILFRKRELWDLIVGQFLKKKA